MILERVRGLFLIASFGWASLAVPAAPTEYQVKAVFLFNFSQFVQWPATAFSAADAPLVIGVLGQDPFGAQLDDVVRGESAGGHPLLVRRFTELKNIQDCHILFITREEQRRLPDILTALKGSNVLTVGDADGFAVNGGMIRLKNERNRIRLNINLKAAEAAGLTISSKLLRPADIVENVADRGEG